MIFAGVSGSCIPFQSCTHAVTCTACAASRLHGCLNLRAGPEGGWTSAESFEGSGRAAAARFRPGLAGWPAGEGARGRPQAATGVLLGSHTTPQGHPWRGVQEACPSGPHWAQKFAIKERGLWTAHCRQARPGVWAGGEGLARAEPNVAEQKMWERGITTCALPVGHLRARHRLQTPTHS